MGMMVPRQAAILRRERSDGKPFRRPQSVARIVCPNVFGGMSDPNEKPRSAGEQPKAAPQIPDGVEDIEGGEVEKPGQSEHDEKRSGEERA
jgi:hypothetical protein